VTQGGTPRAVWRRPRRRREPAREVTEKILAHPLTEGGALLAEAAGVLVSIAGGASLSLGEVNRIMEQITRHCEQAQITLGAASTRNWRPPRRDGRGVAQQRAAAGGPRSSALDFTGLVEEKPLAAGQPRPPSRFVASAPL